MVVVNPDFTCTRACYAELSKTRRDKFDLVSRVMRLPPG